MPHKYLNFGCGERLGRGEWTNIDFHASSPEVVRCNLLGGFPFASSSFEAVYSSHVLEHFTKDQGLFLLSEAFRVVRPGGIIRAVVPDLEGTCREYVRILDAYEGSAIAQKQHKWITIELLDQMVRTTPGGLVPGFKRNLVHDEDTELINYIRTRTQSGSFGTKASKSLSEKLANLTYGKFVEKMSYAYLKILRLLYPKNLKLMAVDDAPLGEKHKWMYDRFSLASALENVGFRKPEVMSPATSGIPDFLLSGLDLNSDGSSYKNNSLYMEAVKPCD
jgi:predicted SAM-dependent methyltransferase